MSAAPDAALMILAAVAGALAVGGLVWLRMHAQVRAQAQRTRVALETLAAIHLERRRLYAAVAHDLRAPLGTIQASMSRLMAGPARPSDQEVARIQNATAHLDLALESAIDLSRVENGEVVLRVERCHGRGLAAAALQRLVGFARSRGLHVAVHAPVDLWIAADRERVLEVLGFLVGAALRYAREAGEVAVWMHRHEHHARFAVLGSSPTMLPPVVGALARADVEAVSGVAAGDLVNALLCERYAAAHGGRIGAALTPRGVIAYLDVPCLDAVPAGRV